MRVGVLGAGSIGAIVAEALRDGRVPGAELAGVVDPAPAVAGLPMCALPELLSTSDLVVECAGQRALAEAGAQVLSAGCDLLVVSVGALAADGLLEKLLAAGPGAVHLSTGAIGGLDLLRSAALLGPFERVVIETTKKASSLVQPWMSEAEADALRRTSSPVELRRGPAREITAAFPKSANVAASVALAVRNWDVVEAAVIADPAAPATSHVITAAGPAGQYRFEIRNRPSPRTPTSSRVVPYAVLSALEALASPRAVFR
ncbi:DUF108 domain-containing protein [Amycolatopsis sp. K13G38]|uniref:L-aspartate dehydrogenase n=1 Tax=Amycolatopsis acididurans TaxID=2724524 RepID=A0ABX1JEH3_9PSEU|nr:aspartate dehydrogenase domain-containing protein [Amycolatopsis acididurans]NKQ57626.1 DUF108 domain-containing protein [Amycolatopsis acididurans]